MEHINDKIIDANRNVDRNLIEKVKSLEDSVPGKTARPSGADYHLAHPFDRSTFNIATRFY